jgi:regulatory protein
VTEAERLQHALDLAYRHLGRRDRTVAEMRDHLAARGVEAELADDVVTELRRQGYLDDARYARRFVADRRTIDAWGSERIESRLLAAGVPAELIAPALAERDTAEELEAAVAVLRRRFAPPVDDRERERALGMLVRKGYELDLAYDAVRAFEREAA